MNTDDFVDLSTYSTPALLDALCALTHKLHALRVRIAEGKAVHEAAESVRRQRDLVREELLRRTAPYDLEQKTK